MRAAACLRACGLPCLIKRLNARKIIGLDHGFERDQSPYFKASFKIVDEARPFSFLVGFKGVFCVCADTLTHASAS